MKYLFILGRNIELSVEEVRAFFRRNGFSFKEIGLIDNGFLVETNNTLAKDAIDQFGGVISIGEVLASGKAKEIFDELDKKMIYFGEENKVNYVLFNFNAEDLNDVSFYLKQKFKKDELKATRKNLTGNIKLQGGQFIPNVASKNIDEQYFIFENHFGRIIQKSDYEKIEERDMKKPVRRNELSISPRLAKILINLAEVKSGETLLDPFCGIGVILEEALLQNIQVVGIDRDKKAIVSAKENLKWFKFDEKNYRLINGDSLKIDIASADCIATEPELGGLLKENPSKEKAREITKDFENLIIHALQNLKRNVRGNIVFTAPLILSRKEKFSCNFNEIASKAGLKILVGPIHEFREDSIIGRDIVVMKR